MKHCIKFEESISAYVDGELGSSDKLLVEEHLRSCPSCLNLLALYHGMSVSLSESCGEAPGSLRDNVMETIKNPSTAGIVTPVDPDEIDLEYEKRVKKRKLVRTVLTRYAPIAACLAIALLVLPQFFNIDRTANEMVDIAPTAALPEMAYDDTDDVMIFAADAYAEIFTEEGFEEAEHAPIAPAGRSDEETAAGGNVPESRADDEIGVHVPLDVPDVDAGHLGGWSMNDSLLEPEYVATAGYYAFIMIEHEFTDTFPLIAYYGDYFLIEQFDVERFIELYGDFIVFFIPGDEAAEFALVQFVM
jgi:hypothetical protein